MKINQLIDDASNKLKNKSFHEAFLLLNHLKSLKVPYKNLDMLRAKCFIGMNQPDAARQALLEELSFFPDNNTALTLLKEIEVKESKRFDDQEFNELLNIIWPYTMLSQERLFSLFVLAKDVCKRNIDGNFVECGVARGGSSALLAYVIKHYSRQVRYLFSCDSFEGMPEPSAEDYSYGQKANDTGWGTGTCAAPEQSVQEICSMVGVDHIVKLIKGYFHETLPEAKKDIKKIAFLHLDGDWYESTKSVLNNLYDDVTDNGIVQVDDYGHWEGCKKAIIDFEEQNKIMFNMHQIDATGIWFIKSQSR